MTDSTDRRRFLITATGAALLFAGDALGARRRPLHPLLREVPFGVPFSGGWRLLEAFGPLAGALVLNIAEHRGPRVRVDVCRRGEPVRGPAFTERLELFVMDGGSGQKELTLGFIEAVGDLASILEDAERGPGALGGLLTHDQRLERHPDHMGRAAVELRPR